MPSEDKEWLRTQAELWQKDNIITPSQKSAILARYGMSAPPKSIEIPEPDKGPSKVISAMATIGAVLIGLGAIVFMASNWQSIPSFLKLIILFGGTYSTYFAGYRLRETTHPKVGRALLLLGSIFSGTTIFLTAQIFHVIANESSLLLIWLIAITPLAYGLDSKSTVYLSQIIFALWMFFYNESNNNSVFLFYGIVLYGLGHLHDYTKYARFKDCYQRFGLFFSLITYYIFVITEMDLVRHVETTWLTYVFMALAFGTVLLSSFSLGKKTGQKHEFGVILTSFVLSSLLFFLSLKNLDYHYYNNVTLTLVLYNVLFFALLVLTVLSGYYLGIPSHINLGLFFFVLYILYFYFTQIFAYLPKSLALIIGGIMLLGGGSWLEKKRRLMIGGAKNEP